MSVVTGSAPPMRSVASTRASAPTKKAPVHGLTISSNLDALLEHDERVRRAQQGPSSPWSAIDSPNYPSSPATLHGLPPPPRRSRVPGSPAWFSPPPPQSPAASIDERRSDTPQSVDSNPYINPAPQWVVGIEPGPMMPTSPPPRTSSMHVDVERVVPTPTDDTTGDSSSPLGSRVSLRADSTPDSAKQPTRQSDTSQGDSRFNATLPKSPSLPRIEGLFKRSSPRDKDSSKDENLPSGHKRSRSRGKLVKQRDPSSPSPQMSEMPDTPRVVRRRRSSRSISVSSAISTDRESFIDLFSPSNQDFPSELIDAPFTAASPTPSSFPKPPKPPIPSTPKPDFTHHRLSTLPAPRRHPSPTGPPLPPVRTHSADTMPPTTNFLNPTERAMLVKKSKKLAQVFGQTPDAAEFVPEHRSSFLDVASPTSSSKSRGHRPAASMNMLGQPPAGQRPIPAWPSTNNSKTIYLNAQGRRHSTPSTPVDDDGQTISIHSGEHDNNNSDEGPSGSPRSFMDFSTSDPSPDADAVSVTETVDTIPAGPGRGRGRPNPRTIPNSPSTPSLFDLSPEERAEEERRRKRDKLAKLHRFLGSRVPASLVLGPEHLDGAPLPPAVVALDGTLTPTAYDSDSAASGRTPRAWRRRSSSAVISGWSEDWDRVKEDLNDKEKASLVRRAQKMEKVFGVAPPQKLYAASNSSSASSFGVTGARTEPTTPTNTPPSTFSRNQNQAPYKRAISNSKQTSSTDSSSRAAQRKSSYRPGTGDSDKSLLPNAEPSAGSFVYSHYQHSLNSLHDILDRNDRESLAELHQYLNDAEADAPPVSPLEFAPIAVRPKAERRRSLPARTSMASLASVASVSTLASIATATTSNETTPDAAATEFSFQQRRRRAAKLTQFFGVDYRELIEDVLDSIEHGLDAERKRGTLNPGEIEDLLKRLRTLKSRR
ncbi:hypothetical protein R3P38DRAFT_2756667 [Favolaschia claudopus]|uniref:Uncharacterized protein n=1 Tax=Favolaschia claudopus TaxID=2862362 RepID=A0AAW0EDW9_9AGAR